MKLTSASITITTAAIGLRTNNGVMAASIVDRHVKSMTATNLFPGAHYGIEVDASKKSWGEVVFTKTDRFIGSAWVGNPFLREMQEFVGVYPPDLLSGDDSQEMIITHLVKTSQWHTDGLGIGDGAAQGFYVLSDNPHAYFETNHDELCIPIVKGDFITFNGRMPHRTVIANGFVDLLGPFDLHSLKDVAMILHNIISEKGDAKGMQDGERQLGEKTGTEKLISGQVFRVVDFDCDANEVKEHHIVYDVTGLGNCPNCKMSIAFSNAQECTKETHDEARMIPLLSDLTYTTDDEGNTGVKYTNFIFDI